jgi:hypothetical protein
MDPCQMGHVPVPAEHGSITRAAMAVRLSRSLLLCSKRSLDRQVGGPWS